jgi:hypothetical protein
MDTIIKTEHTSPNSGVRSVKITAISDEECRLHSTSQKDLQCPSPQMSPAIALTPTSAKLKTLVNDPQTKWTKAPTPISATLSEVQLSLGHGHTENLDHDTTQSILPWEERNGPLASVKEHQLCHSLILTAGSGSEAKKPSPNIFNPVNSVHYEQLQQQHQPPTSQHAIEGLTLAEEDWPTRAIAFSQSDSYKTTLCQGVNIANVSDNAQDISNPFIHTRVRKLSPPRKRKNTRAKKKDPNGSTSKRWTESDDDKVAFLREYGNLKWHEVTEFINGRHTPQAVQMRYLRSLKKRNDSLTPAEKAKLQKIVQEDYENRFKRISTQMGPSFTQVRIQKILLMEAGLGDLLKEDKIWTKEEIGKFIDEAAGDFDNFEVPYRADRLPSRAANYMMRRMSRPYHDLVNHYVGGAGTLYFSL